MYKNMKREFTYISELKKRLDKESSFLYAKIFDAMKKAILTRHTRTTKIS